MDYITLNQTEKIDTGKYSSKGNQLKWKHENEWIKADYMGYEGLVEVLISRLLELSDITMFVRYEPIIINYKGIEYNGCKSMNFLENNEELVTLQKLFRQYTGKNLTKELAQFSEVRDKMMYVVENVKRFTGLKNFGEYLSTAITIDTFFLNEDRHMNNIAVIYNPVTEKYRLCPYFDHGLSLFSDIKMDFGLDVSEEECYEKIEAKPFSRKFDEQLDEIELLYGEYIRFQFGMEDVLKELKTFEGVYCPEILKRVEQVLRLQIRKYTYLFSK